MSRRKRNRESGKLAPKLSRAVLGLIAFFMLFAMMAAAITPDRYNIQVGMPAPNTIKATKEVTDAITTEMLRAAAASEVRSIYTADENIKGAVLDDARARLDALTRLASIYTLPESNGDAVTESQLASVNAQLAPVTLTYAQAEAVGEADETVLTGVCQAALTLLTSVMEDRLQEAQVETKLDALEGALAEQGYDETLASVVRAVLGACVKPNYFYDEAATELARQAERDKIEDVTLMKGEVIVEDGKIVTEAQYKMLDSMGMIKESTMDITLYYGVALLVLLLMAATVMYILLFEREIYASFKTLMLLTLICVIVVGVSLLTRELNAYLMPASLGVLLISILIKRRLAIVMNIVLSLMISLFASASSGFFTMAMFAIMLNSLIAAPVAVLVLKTGQQRTTTLLAGLVIGVSNMISTLAVGLINNANLMTVLVQAEWAAGGGVLAAILCIALSPLLEWIFNLVTPSKLLELSNPNQPLLRRLLLEAPGTYHHSIIVANLAEAAAGEIGANGLLARVGAYYHDIGKLKRPSYFKENQMGDNPHDRTDPRVSTAILTAHTRDGAQMAHNERIPECILEIIRSHHGDTPVMYFYNKSVKENESDVNIDDFRYEGPRPKSREAAIVMLADTIEAAARSMAGPDADKLNQMIRLLIRQKTEDGQLDNCELTLSDLDRICASFLTVLSGVFHERIEYPSLEISKKPGGADKPKPAVNAARKPEAAAPAPPKAAPKPESAAAKPECGTPKPENGAPKPDSGAPKPECGAPKPECAAPKPECAAPKPENGAAKPECAAPKLENGAIKPESAAPEAARTDGEKV